MSTDRRADDPRLTTIIVNVAELQKQMAGVKETVDQVHDVLASFRVIAAVAKWLAAIGAGVAAIYHGADFLQHVQPGVSVPAHK